MLAFTVYIGGSIVLGWIKNLTQNQVIGIQECILDENIYHDRKSYLQNVIYLQHKISFR